MLLQGWEQFDEPVDRIVSTGRSSISAASHRHDDFFKMAYTALPADGNTPRPHDREAE